MREVTWSIPVGARACLLEPNGSGKTTSIRLLQGALAPTTGWVSLLGAVGGPARTYVLAVVLLALGAVAIFAALRWVSFERYLELTGTL